MIVSPQGAPSFVLEVDRVPATAELQRTARVAAIEVRGPLAFSGVAQGLRFVISRDVDTARGSVHLAPDATVLRAVAFQDGSRVDVQIDTRVTFTRLPVPCDALSLDAEPARRTVARRSATANDGTSWIPVGTRLRLRPTLHAPPLRLAINEPEMVSLSRIGTSGDFWNVEYVGMSGSSFRGWVHRSELRPMLIGSYGASGLMGHGTCGIRRMSGPDQYVGPATVAVGTTVYAAAGTGPWAETLTDAPMIVHSVRGQPWVAIRAATGIRELGACAELTHAWVPRSAVHIADASFSTP